MSRGFCIRIFCVVICVIATMGLRSIWAADPSEDFLGAFQDFQTAEKFEQSGNPQEALTKYRSAEKILRALLQKAPEWQPLVVEYRLQKTMEGIARVEANAQQSPTGNLDDLEGDLPTDRSPSRGTATLGRHPARMTHEGRSSADGSLGRPSSRQSQGAQELRNEISRLTAQVARMQAELKSAYHEVDKRKTDVVELRSLNRQLKDQLANIEKDSTSIDSALKQKDVQYAALLKDKQQAMADRDAIEEENEALIKKLEAASSFITSTQDAQASLKKERDEAIAKVKKTKDVAGDVEQLTKDNKALAAKLTELSTRVKKAEADRDAKVREAEKDANRLSKEKSTLDAQLASLNEKLKKVEGERDEKSKTQKSADKQIAQLTEEKSSLSQQLEKLNQQIGEMALQQDAKTKEVEVAKGEVAKLTKESAELTAKLTVSEEKIRAVELERDDLLAKLDKVKKQTTALEGVESKNAEVTEKLEDVEQQIGEVKKGKVTSPEELQALRSQLNSVRDELLAAQIVADQKDTKISDLEKQVDQVTGELANLKLNPEPTEEEQRVQDENALLRGLVLRQLKQAAKIEKTRSTLQEEVQRLQIKSEALDKSLSELDSEKVELTEQEKLLFKEPVVALTESHDGQLGVDMAMVKPSEKQDTKLEDSGGDASKSSTIDDAVASHSATTEDTHASALGEVKSDVLPAELKETVQLAKKLYDEKDFVGAEEQYQKIIDKVPDNYYALTNLAVTQFHLGRLSAAEVALRKAIAAEPSRPDAYTILGIVNYRQSRFDDGVIVLSRAIELNDKDAAAHNYLGITLSEKGDSERAMRELKRAIEINPDYADAHFNLAVIYATAKPPQKDLAKEQYTKAVGLGAPPDAYMEKLVQESAGKE